MGLRHFLFHTRIIQIPALSLEKHRDAVNRVEGRLTVNEQREVKQRLKEMDMPMNLERPIGIEASASMGNDSLQDFMNGFAEAFAKGYEIGRRTASLEHARKLVELGVSWEIITSAIGIKPEDLAT